MNIRFPILLATLAVFGLCVSVPTFAGKNKDCDLPDPHPTCGGDGGDSSPYYNVTVIWPPPEDWVAGSGWYWTAGNNGSVNYAPFNPDFLPDKTTGVLNLDFFQAYFDAKGLNCFPDDVGGDTTVSLHSAGVSYKKSRGAQASFWFKGWTHSGPQVEVLYLLSFFNGELDKTDWPPASLDGPNTMTWGASVESSEWKLKPENEGAENLANSCTREKGKFDPAAWGGPVSIEVTNVPKPKPED